MTPNGGFASGERAPVLQATDLVCGYPGANRDVVQRTSLDLLRGRLVCVIGPNGSGKTTLIRTLSGLLPARRGEVRIGGDRLADLSAQERARRLSVVLTATPAPGYLRVRRMVELGRNPHTGLMARLTDQDNATVAAAMETTGVTGLADRYIGEVSDGERQRAAVARALAQAADIMILDEPTAFLDVSGRATIMTSLKRIAHESGRLVVTTSHDIDLVLRTADQLVIIRDDGSITVGCPEDMALAGTLDHLFPDKTLSFDVNTGIFRLPPPSGPVVELRGRGVRAHWTAHALERIGFRVTRPGRSSGAPVSRAEQSDHDIPAVRISVSDSGWRLQRPDGEIAIRSIEALADELR